jgi:hypothetical protein
MIASSARRDLDLGANGEPENGHAPRRWLLAIAELITALLTLALSSGIAQAGSCTAITTWATLFTCVANGGNIALGADLSSTGASDGRLVIGSTSVVLDTAGHNLTIDQNTTAPGITVPAGDTLESNNSASTGTLSATGGEDFAGIGAAGHGANAGNVVIVGKANVPGGHRPPPSALHPRRT